MNSICIPNARASSYAFVEKSVSKTVRILEKDGRQIICVPAGELRTLQAVHAFVRHAVRVAKEYSILKIAFRWEDITRNIAWERVQKEMACASVDEAQLVFIESLVSHALAAAHDFVLYKTAKVVGGITECAFVDAPHAGAAACERGTIIGEVLNAVRDIANTPANDMTPQVLAEHAQHLCGKLPHTKVTILDKKKIERKKMGLVSAVAQRSQHDARFIIVEYMGGKKGEKPIVLVGKGVTYDTGGIQLKPSSGADIHVMHLDMTGGALCIGAIAAAARLGIQKNIVALVPAVENMISKESYRPGDIITAMNGSTVEVLNTDAEGRLVVADALTYAQKEYSPACIVDVATLTGAALVALGTVANAFMTNTPAYGDRLRTAGARAGEAHWELPLWDEYAYVLKSERADMANIASSEPRYGGTIAGGMFLKQFVADTLPWVHIDSAPRMESNGRDFLGKGSTGEPLRTLVALFRVL